MTAGRLIVLISVGYFALVVTVLMLCLAGSYAADAVRHHRNMRAPRRAIEQAVIDHQAQMANVDRMVDDAHYRDDMERLTRIYGDEARRTVKR